MIYLSEEDSDYIVDLACLLNSYALLYFGIFKVGDAAGLHRFLAPPISALLSRIPLQFILSRSKIGRAICTISTLSLGFAWLGMTRGKFAMVFVPTHVVWAIAFSRGLLYSSGRARSTWVAFPFP